MQGNETGGLTDRPDIAKSSGTGEGARPHDPDPVIVDLNRARKDRGAEGADTSGERVADAGDAGGGSSLPAGPDQKP